MLQKSGKPVVLAVNKCDSIGEPPMELYEFYNLGIGDPFPISAAHGHGTGDMLDAVYDLLPPEDQLEDDEDAIHVAIIGKPNVGKSSLVNGRSCPMLPAPPVMRRIRLWKTRTASSC